MISLLRAPPKTYLSGHLIHFPPHQGDLRSPLVTSAEKPGAAFTLVEPLRSPKPHDSRTQRWGAILCVTAGVFLPSIRSRRSSVAMHPTSYLGNSIAVSGGSNRRSHG